MNTVFLIVNQERWNECIFNLRLNVNSDGEEVTSDGKSFHTPASATGKRDVQQWEVCQQEQADDRRWRSGVFVETGCQRWA